MDFTLDDEQTALRDAVRGLLKGYDAETRRAATAEDPGFDEDMWHKLADMGVLGLPFSEDDGGSGAGPVELAVVAEEIGRVIAPEPFVESVVLAGGLVAAAGTSEQRKEILGGLSSGELLLAFAHAEPGGRWSPAAGGVTADGDTLTGVKEPVLNGARADLLVVSALVTNDGADDGVGLFVVDPKDLDRASYPTFDGGRAARISFDKTPATPLGDGGDASAVVANAFAIAQIAYCHEALGAMDAALALTTSYLTTRKQFGVTLNRFQSLNFRAADMYTSLELTRSMVSWATMVLADGTSTPEKIREAASRAKLQTSKAGRHIGQEAIQLHGGIGMTAEYIVGHLTARLTAIDHLLGDGREHTSRLARTLTDHTVVEPLP